ncbi:SLC13 family permease [Novosphingobium sp. RD2P27]|uniref:SLC13 family permease n=1 Tax=Novosphingobium kalidii TaxID=3230299 RepID=A0ABV2D3B8_9SPHN
MTLDQALSFGIIGAVVVLLIWDKLRYDVVSVLGLLAAVAAGLVDPDEAFSGFSDDIVLIIASALVVSAGIARSGLVDMLIRPVAPKLNTPGKQVAALGGTVAVLSAFMKNIGALAIFLPVAQQLARRHRTQTHFVLMPLAFASLMGGLMTLVGTSPNLMVSRVREGMVGEPFSMFDYLPVGLGVTLAGMLFLTVGWRLLPADRQGARSAEDAFAVEDYVSELVLPETSEFVGRRIADVEKLASGEVRVVGIVREEYRRLIPDPDWEVHGGDILLIEGDAPALQRVIVAAGLMPASAGAVEGSEVVIAEAVVQKASPLIGQTPAGYRLGETSGLEMVALSRRGHRLNRRLSRVAMQEGDLLLLRSPATNLGDRLSAAGLFPLAERRLQIGQRRPLWVPVAILAAAIASLAFQLAPVGLTFLAAAAAMIVSGVLKPDEAYQAIEWPILVLIGALIPVSETLESTGGTEIIAAGLSAAVDGLPPFAVVAVVMAAAMAVTPFLNNAATVLVMAPIGATLATKLGLRPDAFLMAVAVGAGSDFLTPIGHQCNTLVMGPGGYRFADYPRLGIPLSLMILVLGTALIMYFWPL